MRLVTSPWYHKALKSSPLSVAYTRQWTGSSLVQVMARRLFGAEPLPEPMQAYCQLDSCEQISIFEKMHLKMSSVRMAVILSRGKWVKIKSTLKRARLHSNSAMGGDIQAMRYCKRYHIKLIEIQINGVRWHNICNKGCFATANVSQFG